MATILNINLIFVAEISINHSSHFIIVDCIMRKRILRVTVNDKFRIIQCPFTNRASTSRENETCQLCNFISNSETKIETIDVK